MSAAFSFSSGNAPGAGAQAFAGIGPNGQPIAMAQAGVPGQGGAQAFAGAGAQNGAFGPQGPQGPQGPHHHHHHGGGQMAKMMNFIKGFMMGKMMSQMMQGMGLGQGMGQGLGMPGGQMFAGANPGFGGLTQNFGGPGFNGQVSYGNPAFAQAGGAQPFGNMLGGFLG